MGKSPDTTSGCRVPRKQSSSSRTLSRAQRFGEVSRIFAVPEWLGLEEAARRLSVHPATLREWADKGRIRTFRTPGGHRRFSESDVLGLEAAHVTPDLSLLMHATVGQTRIATSRGRLATEAWYARFDDSAKQRQ